MSTTISVTDEELIELPVLGIDGSGKMPAKASMTDEELMQLPKNGYKYDYVNGGTGYESSRNDPGENRLSAYLSYLELSRR